MIEPVDNVSSRTGRERAAAALLRGIAEDPWGEVSASVYETARLVTLAPWLGGHRARLEFLCRSQAADGGWGEPDGYGLVPTLSATEALLTSVRRPSTVDGIMDRARLAEAAARGLTALRRWLATDAGSAPLPVRVPVPVPDTIAVEVIVPALVEAINAHLEAGADRPDADASALAVPHGFDSRAATDTAQRDTAQPDAAQPDAAQPDAAEPDTAQPDNAQPDNAEPDATSGEAGLPAPQTWWASLEVLGPAAARVHGVRPYGGAVGCSPSATAAWLGGPAGGGQPRPAQQAIEYLERLQARGGGPGPGVTPITFFERAWVLSSLAGSGLARTPPAQVLDSLDEALGPLGTPAAPGLPPDSDDAAVVLTALARHGRSRPADCLLDYRAGDHFACFPGERTPSTSTNAHVLEALDARLATHPDELTRLWPAAALATDWLLGQQRPDGSWLDKWHASPYYATLCCTQALAERENEACRRALARAGDWVLATQREDGSWGRWGGTVEETAYAIQILAAARVETRPGALRPAVAAGAAYLREEPASTTHRGLWHAKDLYAPLRVIRAARLAALSTAAVIVRQAERATSAPGAAGAASRTPAPRRAAWCPAPAGSGSPRRRR